MLHFGENKQAVFLNGSRTMPIGAVGRDPRRGLGRLHDADGYQQGRGRLHAQRCRWTGNHQAIYSSRRVERKDGIYVVRMDLTFRNTGSADLERKGYFVSAGGAAPIHPNDWPMYTKFDWMHEGKFTSIDVNWFDASSVPLLGIQMREARNLYLRRQERMSRWTGVASQYFCTIVTAAEDKGISVVGDAI